MDVIAGTERVLKKPAFDEPAFHEIEEVKKRLSEKWGLKKLVGKSPSFLEVVNKVPLVARSDVSVLIQGETGTGKELFARALHYLSPRAKYPFLPVNSATLPAALFENEFFGHAKEAFTDARSSRPGLIREAEGGTVFLDEIDTLEQASQAKLLRFLDEKEYKPLGSGKPIKVNVRVIAASNTDLKESIEEGRFRRDLFFRVNVITLILPPLRHRREDVPVLAGHFLKKYERKFGVKRFSHAAMEKLSSYAWPGNIRELENMVQQVMIMVADPVIGPESLPLSFQDTQYSSPACRTFQEGKTDAMETFEREYIANILRIHNGNITQAAKAAGKDRRVFGRLVKKHKPFLEDESATDPPRYDHADLRGKHRQTRTFCPADPNVSGVA